MKIKDLINDMMNEARERRAYDLKRGNKFFKNYKRTQQNYLDLILTMANNHLRAIKGLIN